MDKLLKRAVGSPLITLNKFINTEAATGSQNTSKDTDTKKTKTVSSKPNTRKSPKIHKGKESEQGKQKRKPVLKKSKRSHDDEEESEDDYIPRPRKYEGHYVRMSDLVGKCGLLFQSGFDRMKPDRSSEILIKTKLEKYLPSHNVVPQSYPTSFVKKPPPAPPSSSLSSPKYKEECGECCKTASSGSGFWS
ncbi:uncharacterized protein [Halyomorpha halys]|uniref:uncharacterized protein isoform X2 n=1 Tax=Halyomorpha halys TaxID=286706 RepID=UPI0006D4E8D0|nr:uncharacterized protein LOC106692593 isoform X3 [Halyomorpha halys]